METVEQLIKEIHGVITQTTGSRKDEIRVLKAMVNDKSYKVDLYDKTGKYGSFCPAEAMQDMATSIVSSAAKITHDEARSLINNYEFKKNEVEDLLDISKEFVHTYLHTGRKLNLGGREKSDISLSLKTIESGTRSFPKMVGYDNNGKPIYERGVTKVDGYESMKVYAPCPSWVKKESK